ncbi:MAG: DUF6090 family protein [Parvularculaceae bacterium]
MILRRITEHVKAQNWFAVAIDFVIVVVGVFVGLQVSNWNAARADRSREAGYLAGLAQDIRIDIADIDEIIRVSSLRMSAMSYLLEQAGGAPLPDGFDSARGRIAIEPSPAYDASDPNTIGIAMFILTTLDGNRLTYDTMINAGGIGIIRDTAMAREIQTYYAHVDKALSFEEALGQSRVELVGAQQEAGLSPVDASEADDLAALFRSDPKMLAAAKNYWLYTNRHLKDMKTLRDEAERLAGRLESGARP